MAPPSGESSADSELVKQARLGDAAAFSTLLQRHDLQMRRLAVQLLGNQDAMDDALQDAYLKAYRSLADFRGESAFSSWLYRIVTTTCIDHQRHNGRRREVPLDAVAEAADPRRLSDEVATSQAVQGALDALSTDHLAAIVLVDAHGLSYDEAAQILETTTGTVASRLNRARAAVRTHLTSANEDTQ